MFSTLSDVDTLSLTGRADALYMEDDQLRIVIDWKSDVKPTDSEVEIHAAQLRVYMRAARAERGALVYFSSGQVHWLVPPTSESVFQGVIGIPPAPKSSAQACIRATMSALGRACLAIVVDGAQGQSASARIRRWAAGWISRVSDATKTHCKGGNWQHFKPTGASCAARRFVDEAELLGDGRSPRWRASVVAVICVGPLRRIRSCAERRAVGRCPTLDEAVDWTP